MAGVSLKCGDCGTLLRSESDLHTKRTGHHEYVNSTLETVMLISWDVHKDCNETVEMVECSSSSSKHEEMVVPEVDQKLLEELEGMGFPKARAYQGTSLLWAVSV
ncbi:hypothetical protein LOK49_Contig213G00001 [Camellia lanceoleosa]|nr:hypothetical protein LOK49_Contig213G00001 [Camellia lanceoleosa]